MPPSEWGSTITPNPLIQKVDCAHVEVSDLEAGLALYRDKLGHELVWRTDTAAGLNMGGGSNEIVLNSTPWKHKTDLLVDSAPEAARRFEESGGAVLSGPFEIAIGQAAVVRDPWGNEFVLHDLSNGRLATDAEGNVEGD
jgi:predicted enzyme related to lactoylglutathione lyase